MKTFMMLVLFFICYIPTLIIAAITPYITRKTESFGVSIPEEEYSNPEVQLIRKNYRNRLLLFGGSLSALALLLVLMDPSDHTALFLPGGTFVLLFLMFAFYWDGHKKMEELKRIHNWMGEKTQLVVVDTGFRNKKVMASPLWFILYLAVILVTVALGFALYDKLPDRIAMHWNINGEVDRWAEKSYKTVLWAPLVQIFMTFIMAYSYWIIGKSKQLIDPSAPEKSAEQNRTFRYRWSVFTLVTGLLFVMLFGFMQFLSYGYVKNSWVIIGLPLVLGLGVVAASIILSVTTGQGGSRVYRKEVKTGEKTESKVVSRDEDRFWKLGLFYYNPDDPAFIVEKRFGIGWTNNWARPISWVITIGLFAAIILFSVVTALMAK